MRLPPKHELMEVLGWLGFSAQDFSSAMAGATSMEDARQRLEKLRKRIRKAGRSLYRELHPDLNAGPGAEERKQRMSRLTNVLEALDHMDVGVVRRPTIRVIHTTKPFDGFNTTATTTAVQGFNGFHPGSSS